MNIGRWTIRLKNNGVFGALMHSTLAACAPTDLPLGDEMGGEGGGAAQGGTTGLAGSTGISGSTSIAGYQGIAGHTSNGGQSSAGGGGGGEDCFAPQHRPELALVPGAKGCACTTEPPQCIAVDDNSNVNRLSLQCSGSVWISVENGVCGGTGASCLVNGNVYPDGASNVPDLFDCSRCTCTNGELTACVGTNQVCANHCPDGTTLVAQCTQCGLADQCTQKEQKCLPSCAAVQCETGKFCIAGTCRDFGLCG
jgi:hypothetical protein